VLVRTPGSYDEIDPGVLPIIFGMMYQLDPPTALTSHESVNGCDGDVNYPGLYEGCYKRFSKHFVTGLLLKQ